MDGKKVTIKLQLGEDVRRCTLKALDYTELSDAVYKLFQLPEESWRIYYVDDEGDQIGVTCTIEMVEAVGQAVNSLPRFLIKPESANPLRDSFIGRSRRSSLSSSTMSSVTESLGKLSVKEEVTNVNSIKESVKKENLKVEVNHNAQCDICTQKIFGIRYRCSNCEDYDLCKKCEKTRPHNPTHLFLKIYKPLQLTRGSLIPHSLYVEETKEVEAPKIETLKVDHVVKPVPEPQVTAVPVCDLSASFMRDTVDDGSVFLPGEKFNKVWTFKNEGKHAWPAGTKLTMTEGASSMILCSSVDVPSVEPQQEVDISVEFLAPKSPGKYVSYWRLVNPDGERFGHRIWVDIKVQEKAKDPEPAPVPVPVPVPEPIVSKPEPVVETKPINPSNKNRVFSTKQFPPGVRLEDLSQLMELGFKDEAKCIALLLHYRGNLENVIEHLLNEGLRS